MGIWVVRRDYFKLSWDRLLLGLQVILTILQGLRESLFSQSSKFLGQTMKIKCLPLGQTR